MPCQNKALRSLDEGPRVTLMQACESVELLFGAGPDAALSTRILTFPLLHSQKGAAPWDCSLSSFRHSQSSQAVEKLPRAAPSADWLGWRGANEENMRKTYLTTERQGQTGQDGCGPEGCGDFGLPPRCSSLIDHCGYAQSSRLAERPKSTRNADGASFSTAC